jgi:AraC-like DNA-binding protein
MTLNIDSELFYEQSVDNPLLLGVMYYTFGLSLNEIAEEFGVSPRTIRRRMDFFGFHRHEEDFSMLVKYHGIENALKLMEPKYKPLGDYAKYRGIA